MDLRDLYAMMLRDYGTRDPLDLALAGDCWVMDEKSFRSVIAACKAAGVIYPPDYEPGPQDRLFGLPVEIREDAGTPHVERGQGMRKAAPAPGGSKGRGGGVQGIRSAGSTRCAPS